VPSCAAALGSLVRAATISSAIWTRRILAVADATSTVQWKHLGRGAPQPPDQSDRSTHACGLVGSKASSAEQKPQGARRISTLQGAAEPVGGETTLVSTLRLIKFR
jgi:hypothetical protein